MRPRLRTRLYKHEANLGADRRFHKPLAELGRDFWVAYVKALVRMHFNALVFYAGYRPFEYFLDYREFPEAVEQSRSARVRRQATLEGLRRAFGVARASVCARSCSTT